jgi:putative ABC transport system substrate-binding protein
MERQPTSLAMKFLVRGSGTPVRTPAVAKRGPVWHPLVAGVIGLLALGIVLWPARSDAQQTVKVPRIGYLSADGGAAASHLVEAFRQGLRTLGYVEGQSVTIDYRFADGKYERLPDLARELVQLRVDVLMVFTIPATRAAKATTTKIPIVFAQVLDPVGAGLVAGLARPGANVTGVSVMIEDLGGKYIQLLQELMPWITDVGILWEPAQPAGALQLKQIETAATSLGVRLHTIKVLRPSDFEAAFVSAKTNRARALFALPSSLFNLHWPRLANLAVRHQVPTISARREFVSAGGLMSYGPDFADQARRAASYVDRILKGAKPADLPVEQPTKFELVINLKTAKALDLTIPSPLLIRADYVIE